LIFLQEISILVYIYIYIYKPTNGRPEQDMSLITKGTPERDEGKMSLALPFSGNTQWFYACIYI